MSSFRPRIHSKYLEICVAGISHQTEPHNLLCVIIFKFNQNNSIFSRAYFEQFGNINHYSFTSPNGGGLVFITYENTESVDRCLANRPHRIDGRHL
jgi:hypothetical protein